MVEIDDIKDIDWSTDAVVEALEREEREIESSIPDRDRVTGERWAMWRYNVKLFPPKGRHNSGRRQWGVSHGAESLYRF